MTTRETAAGTPTPKTTKSKATQGKTSVEQLEEQAKASGDAAAKFLSKRADKAEAEEKERLSGVVSYLECRRCGGPGIWVFNKPSANGWLSPDDWEASYKPRGIRWPSSKVICQCCLDKAGAEVQLPMLTDGGVKYRPNPTHLYEITREEFEELKK